MKKQEMNKFEIAKIDAKNLKELEGFEEAQKQLVKDNPFVEPVDSQTYKEAKIRWANVRSGRTGLESQDKLIGSFVSAFRKDTKAKILSLIGISKPLEDKFKTSINNWEQKEEKRLEAKREEKRRKEEERIDTIKKHIEKTRQELEFLTAYLIESSLEDVKKQYEEVVAKARIFDCQEYDFLMEEMLNAAALNLDAEIEKIEKNKELKEQIKKIKELNAEKREREEREEKERSLRDMKEVYLDLINQCANRKELILEKEKFEKRTNEVPIDLFDIKSKYMEMREFIIFKFEKRESEIDRIIEDRKKEEEEDKKYKIDLLKEFDFELREGFWILGDNKINTEDLKETKKTFEEIVNGFVSADKEKKENKRRQERLKSDKKMIIGAIDLIRYSFETELKECKNEESESFLKNAMRDIEYLCDDLEVKLNNL